MLFTQSAGDSVPTKSVANLSGVFSQTMEPGNVIGRTGTTPTLFSGVMDRTAQRLADARRKVEPRRIGGPVATIVAPMPDVFSRPVIAASLPATGAPQEGTPAPAAKPAALASTRVEITRARFPIWRRSAANLADYVKAQGGLKDMTIPVGRYVFTFDAATKPDSVYSGFAGNVPFEVMGKKVAVEKVLYRQDRGEIQVQVRIDTNPVPVLALVAAAAGVVLLPMLNDSLKQIDRVIVDVSNAALAGVVVLGAWWVFIGRRKRRS